MIDINSTVKVLRETDLHDCKQGYDVQITLDNGDSSTTIISVEEYELYLALKSIQHKCTKLEIGVLIDKIKMYKTK